MKEEEQITGRFNIVGVGTVIEGNIHSQGDLRIDGHVIGTVKLLERLAIGPTGRVEGDVFCSSADISGNIKGNVEVQETLFLKKSAKILGDIKVGRLIVESGAEFLGSCTMISKDNQPPSENDKA
jgi:cytoskeletal protein CcmA (bactofilin family)